MLGSFHSEMYKYTQLIYFFHIFGESREIGVLMIGSLVYVQRLDWPNLTTDVSIDPLHPEKRGQLVHTATSI